jgi:hypothetical protein
MRLLVVDFRWQVLTVARPGKEQIPDPSITRYDKGTKGED